MTQPPDDTKRAIAALRDAFRQRADLLRQSQLLEHQAEQIMLDAIINARSGQTQLTWDQIGDVLGVTYQRAHQRWANKLPNRPSPTHPQPVQSQPN